IWVAAFNSGSLTKLLASSGAVLGTYTVAGGPDALAFDGSNIWVAQQNIPNNMLTKVLASSGAVLGNYAVGSYPAALAFDGSNIWVANINETTVTSIPVN